MYRKLFTALLLTGSCLPANADLEQLVPTDTLALIANEVSGVSAKRNLDTITLYHRTRASSQFRQSADHVHQRLLDYGFDSAQILEYPADGQTMFGTQKSRFAWEVEFAELWELDKEGQRVTRHANWEALPLSLAQDSVSGAATASLVDIGAGTADSDFEGKDIRGRLVLTSSQPGVVADKAVGQLGAAGIISYAPNQKSAWWKEDDRLIRWGHLDGFAETRTFAFMISLKTARQLRQRLASGEDIRFDAQVEASLTPGKYSLVSAMIAGSDPDLAAEEIVYTCHLDHPRPGANDNASGCVSILEAARALNRLVQSGALPAPRRSLRFIWPAEIEGTLIYLESLPETGQIKANIHLDMVGGNPQTKSVFRVSGGPMSLPHFVADVGHEIGHFVNTQTLGHASGESVAFPLVSREGSKNPQLAVMEGISLGSDHQVFNEGTWKIPGIYLHDWPDRYIHTNFDTAAMIDPTKLKRAAFIAAVQGWYLANLGSEDIPSLVQLVKANSLARARQLELDLASIDTADQLAVRQVHAQVERMRLLSINSFATMDEVTRNQALSFLDGLGALTAPLEDSQPARANDSRVFRRNASVRGPMHAFGYSYLEDKLGPEAVARLQLSGALAYETLNLVDGSRSVSEIRDWLLAEFGTADLQAIGHYLEALEHIDVVEQLQ